MQEAINERESSEAGGDPLTLMVYDATCRGTGPLPGLTHSWMAGGTLFRELDRFDAVRGVGTWMEGLEWLAEFARERAIGEIQFWGHGKWGRAMVDGEDLDVASLESDSPHYEELCRIRDRLAGRDALWWFRTCETFGCRAGHDFARRWTDFFGCRAASHTFIIGPWQSGLHVLRPGESPDWPVDEGLAEGSPSDPDRALWSTPWQPSTIFCLTSRLPEDL